jgi:Glycosyltransferase family 87
MPGLAHQRSSAVLFIAVIFAAAMVYYHLFLFVPKVLEARAARGLGNGYSFGDDFYPVWLTSREALLHHQDPYSPEMTRAIQIGLFGRPLNPQHPLDPSVRYREFAYPAFVDIVFSPIAYFPFSAVRVGLAIFLPIMTAISVLLWFRAMDVRAAPEIATTFVFLTLCNYPILEALFAEQAGLFVGFAAAAALTALAAHRYVAAGALLALTTIKPQMTVLLVFFLLLWSIAKWRERRLLIVSFAAIELLLCIAALLVWPRWVQQWLTILFNYRNYSTPPLIVDLLGSEFGALFGRALIAILVAGGIAVAWRMRGHSSASPRFWLAVALILSITVVAILPGQAVYDHIILLPGIIFAARFWRRFVSTPGIIRWLFCLATVALFWQWIAALTIISLRPLISSERFYSVPIFALPIRMAGAFPFALLALLAVVMRYGIPQNFVENCVEDSCVEPNRARPD